MTASRDANDSSMHSFPVFRDGLGDATGRTIQRKHGYLEYRYGPAGTCEIVNIEVQPFHRGKGIGTELLRELEKDPLVNVIYAFTAEENEQAHAWYVKNGFQMIAVPRFYGKARGAYLCVREVR